MLPQLLFLVIFVHHGHGFPFDLSSEDSYDPNGTISSRIVGGMDAPPRYAPYMVAIVRGEVLTALVCGGSLVTRLHVLTAAHCIHTYVTRGQVLPSYRGIVGSDYWNSTETRISFYDHLVHPGWDPFTIKNDIGFLMTRDVTLDDRITVIPLNFNWIRGGVRSLVTGWGVVGEKEEENVVNLMTVPDKLQLLYVRTISPQQCADGIRQTTATWGWSPPLDPAIEICTYHSPGHGMCHGDSGSALVLQETRQQIGIVSWGFPCAVGAPDVFVRISGFKHFILSEIYRVLTV